MDKDLKYRSEKWLREKYLDENMPTTKMARLADCHPSTIRKWMVRHGIKRRSNAEAKTENKPYTSQKWLRLNYVERGKSTSDLAASCNCTRSTIRFWLRRHNISTRPAGGVSEYEIDMEWLRQQYETHEKTIREIAELIGCHSNTVSHHLKQLGVTTRKQTGTNHYNWKGGVTPLHEKIRKCEHYTQWRSSVFDRDQYTCQWCDQKGGEKHADHIYPFSYILEDHNIQTIEDALECDALWDVDNGRTLCYDCHRATPTYGNSDRYDPKTLSRLDHQAKVIQLQEEDDDE